MSANSGPVGAPGRELLVRAVSAIVLAAGALLVTWVGGNAFAVLCVVAGALIAHEYRSLTMPATAAVFSLAGLAALAAALAVWFFAGAKSGFAALALAALLLAIAELAMSRRFWAAFGVIYAGLPVFALALLRGDAAPGFEAVVIVFAGVWGADIFAYFCGRAIGGPKLAPSISPKKTWAGFFGGLAGSAGLAAGALALFGHSPGMPAIGLAIFLSLVSQAGDLVESVGKRRFGVKDSGNLIPGHGGVLDRLDGLIFAGVAAWLVGGWAGGELFVPGKSGAALISAISGP